MPLGVRYGYDHLLLLDDRNKVWSDDLGIFGAPAEIISPVSLTQLGHALKAHADVWGDAEAPLWVSSDSPTQFDDEESEPLPYRLVFADGELLLAIDLEEEAESLGLETLREGLRPITSRWRAEVLDVIAAEDGDENICRLYLRFPTLRRSGHDAFPAGRGAARGDPPVAGRRSRPFMGRSGRNGRIVEPPARSGRIVLARSQARALPDRRAGPPEPRVRCRGAV